MRQYYDIGGEPIELIEGVKACPAWAANQIRRRDILEAENTRLRKSITGAITHIEALCDAYGQDDHDSTVLNALHKALKPGEGV